MAGRLAIDFGTSNTLIARWDPDRASAEPLRIPDISRPITYRATDVAWVIPSLIHFAAGDRRWLGQQVLSQGLYDSPRTFRWMMN